ncbi:MAG: chitobiase/beta-hexosaminidase C-terminal domain-containing protein [Clostridia bacterium]|nr:chitobiase/beta-hexosaminidase C-terminal domain-containing protein [Clostridia bacterium]
MKRIVSLFLVMVLVLTSIPFGSISFAETFSSDLIISEYVEGGGFNKALEIYNGTGQTVNLTGYTIEKDSNGNGVFNESLTLGTSDLIAGDTFVVSRTDATGISADAVDLFDGSKQTVNWNGDDQVRLLKDGVVIDVFGVPGGINFAKDQTYVRKANIYDGRTTSYTSVDEIANEWDVYPKDTASYLGSHIMGNVVIPVVVANVEATVASGEVAVGTMVTLSTETVGAHIYFTTDGNDPVVGTNGYSAPIEITENVTIKAIASKEGATNSGISTFEYTIPVIVTSVADVTASVLSGEVYSGTRVELVTETADAHIYYTTDGTEPIVGTNEYVAPITITEATTIMAVATKEGLDNSNVSTFNYTIKVVATDFTDLIISEYLEGGSNNKALELYNGTSSPIDMTGYKLVLFSNGSDKPGNTMNLEGTLASGACYVIYHASSIQAIKNVGNQDSTVCYFNGDDTIVLYKGETIIDSIGKFGFDPGSEFKNNGVSTANMTLVRKLSVKQGDTNINDEFDPSVEWDAYPQDTVEYLGSYGAGQEVVANVLASLPNGKYPVGTEVELTTTTEGASIYYTTDGTEPVAGTNLYAAPISITENVTIKAIATKEGALNSGISTFEYTVPAFIDLIISEYIEGSSNNKAIEIYNGTGREVDLTAYTVKLFVNGESTAKYELNLTGTLADNDCYVIYNASANDAIKTVGDVSSTVTYFNGDDDIVLYKGDVVIDSFGKVGTDPGDYYDINGVKTQDKTLVRKLTVTRGDTVIDDAFDPSLEWEMYDKDTVDYLGYYGPKVDPLLDYYKDAVGLTGEALKAALNDIIDGHTVRSYSQAYDDLIITDADPKQPGNIIQFYNGLSVNGAAQYANGAGWNREHVWAKSHGDFGTANGPGTDLHQLRATDVDVNTVRNHFDFAELDETAAGVTLVNETTDCYVINYGDAREGLFEPREEVKGDVARILFYMATRYEGEADDGFAIDLELSNSALSVAQTQSGVYGEHGILDVLLQWHIQDPVDALEMARNETIYGIQGNRNPYIDHPEYVASIWGTVKPPELNLNIKEALALGKDTENVTVTGQIAYFATSYGNPVLQANIDGQNYSLYVFGGAPDGAKIGDTVKMNGKYVIYGGLPELSNILSASIVSTSEPAVIPEEVTLDYLSKNGLNMLGRFVKIKDVTLGEFADKSTPITDATGSLSIYKATPYPTLVEKGDVVDLYGMVACYNTSVQLYVGTKEDNGFNIYDIVNDTKAPLITLEDQYLDAKVNTDYTITIDAADNKGIDTVLVNYKLGEATISDQAMAYDDTLKKYKFVVPGTSIVSELENIEFTFKATDITGLSSTANVTVLVDNKPQITEVLPTRGSNLGTENSPLISVTLENAGINPEVKLSLTTGDNVIVSNAVMHIKEADKVYEYNTSALEDGTYVATVIVTRADGISNVITWTFTVGTQKYTAYFGQLHAHTAEYSDGSGTLANGLDYLKNLPSSENVNFVSFTDHSNYFDTTSAANPAGAMNDTGLMTAESLLKWNTYRSTVANFNNENAGVVQAMAGYEMTWSGGPGHINTFNSIGLVSRNDKTLNNKTGDAGLKAYYDTLILNTEPLANLSQFNHPGKTFGTFADFAYWSPAIDNKMVAVEVGNGEGAIGSGGYFPSYTEYTKALDKGWHVAPTNNQDNHKGKWGNANTARTVIITDQFTNEGLLTGMKNMSVYATEDKNLDIQYTVNNQMMGSIISEVPTEPLQFVVKVNDPDNGDMISKIEIVSNGGRVLNSQTFSSESADWSFELPSQQAYYYVRVTQADKNIAVTAPIWIGQAPLVGISSFETETKLPVTDEALTFTTTMFNNESQPVTVKSVEYKLGDVVLETKTLNEQIVTNGTLTNQFSYTPTTSENIVISVKAIITVAGEDKVFDQKVELYVRDASKLTYVGIDASHYNEYVAGNYKDSMGNFANMAVESDVRVVELKTSEDLIAATQNPQYKMIILTPPTRRNGNAFLLGYKSYSEEEIVAIRAFAEKGNTVIVTGWGDYYESYDKYSDGTAYTLPADQQMSAQQNTLLAALGSNIRVSDDEVKDDTNNGGSPQRLYFTEYNLLNQFAIKVSPSEQVYSNYGGATIYTVDSNGQPSSIIPATVSPMVYSFATSYSSDDDKDGTTGITGVLVPKYNDKYMIAASEKVAYDNGKTGTIIVAGSAFMSNFEIQATMDSYSTPAYSNYTILQEIVNSISAVEITKIADLHAANEGQRFVTEGIVTSNASGYDKDTAFFDSIYLQDETAGINAFPVAGDIRAGQKVRIKGITSSYNGERQINVLSIEIIDENVSMLPEPIVLTTKEASQAMNLGSLVKVSGTVTNIELANGIVESIFIKDQSNVETRVFVDGYITSTKTIENLAVGNVLEVVGLSSISTEGPRIRVRDRDDITCTLAKKAKEIEVRINKKTLELEVGTEAKDKTYQLKVTVSGASNQIVVWSSSDETVATVDQNGVVTAVGAGKATITAKRVFGSQYAKATVEVFLVGEEVVPLGSINTKLPYISGYPNGKFMPDQAITRAEVAAIFAKILPSRTNDVILLQDVSTEHWAYSAIQASVSNGLFSGYQDGTFRPDAPITRGEIAAVVSNYWKLLGQTKDSNETDTKDVKDHWAHEAIYRLYRAELVSGYPDGTFRPDDFTKRAEFVVIMNKLLGRNSNGSGSDKYSDIQGHWAEKEIMSATELAE